MRYSRLNPFTNIQHYYSSSSSDGNENNDDPPADDDIKGRGSSGVDDPSGKYGNIQKITKLVWYHMCILFTQMEAM